MTRGVYELYPFPSPPSSPTRGRGCFLVFPLPPSRERVRKAVSVPPSPLSGDRLIQCLFHANPDVLAEALVDFVRQDPVGQRQTAALKAIFNSHSLRQDCIECFYPPESYAQKVQGLKTAAAGIDDLRAEKGLSRIVDCVVTSIELQKEASRQYRALF